MVVAGVGEYVVWHVVSADTLQIGGSLFHELAQPSVIVLDVGGETVVLVEVVEHRGTDWPGDCGSLEGNKRPSDCTVLCEYDSWRCWSRVSPVVKMKYRWLSLLKASTRLLCTATIIGKASYKSKPTVKT